MERLIIQNGTVLPLNERPETLTNGTIVIEDGIIVDILKEKQFATCAPDEIIDARGGIVMPGLVNAHTHLFQVLLRALWDDIPLIPWLKKIYHASLFLEPEDFYFGAELGLLEAIKSGVTTVCDHHFLNATLNHTLATVRAALGSGVRTVVARTVMDQGDLVPDSVIEASDKALGEVGYLIDDHKEVEISHMLKFMTGPNTPPLNASTRLIQDIKKFADDREIGVSVHVAEGRDVVDLVREEYGYGGVVEYLESLGLTGPRTVFAHCVHVNKREIELLKHTGTTVVHNPVSNCMLGDGIAPVTEMVEMGVNVALGTDGAASNHSQDMFEVMKMCSLLQRVRKNGPTVVTPYRILRMATFGGARAFGLEDVIGTIEVGKLGDLIVVDVGSAPHNVGVHDLFSHLVHSAKACDVTNVVVNGHVVMAGRQVLTMNERRSLEAARERVIQLAGRIEQIGPDLS